MTTNRMHSTITSWLSLTIAFLYLFDAVSATALSDFAPLTTGLTGQCQTIYTQQIAGCSNSDFAAASSCSSACLSGLVAIGNQINTACRGASVSSSSIIGLFLNGQGIQILCNVAVVTTTTGTSTATPSSTSSSSDTPAASSTVAATTSENASAPSSSSSAPALSGSATTTTTTNSSAPSSLPSSSMSSKPTLLMSSSSISSQTSTSSGDSATATDQVSIRNGNVHSGGGSPFDNITNSEAASLRLSWLGGLLTLLVLSIPVFCN